MHIVTTCAWSALTAKYAQCSVSDSSTFFPTCDFSDATHPVGTLHEYPHRDPAARMVTCPSLLWTPPRSGWAGRHVRFDSLPPRYSALYIGAGLDTRFLKTPSMTDVTRFTCASPTPVNAQQFAKLLDSELAAACLPLDQASPRTRTYGSTTGRQARYFMDTLLPADTWKLASSQYHSLVVGCVDPPACTTMLLHRCPTLVLYPEAWKHCDQDTDGVCAHLSKGLLSDATFAKYAIIDDHLATTTFRTWDETEAFLKK